MPFKTRRLVFTIHGINSSGAWQRNVEPVFEPHFDYKQIKYRDYLCFGATKLFLWPWSAVLLLALATGGGTLLFRAVLSICVLIVLATLVISEFVWNGVLRGSVFLIVAFGTNLVAFFNTGAEPSERFLWVQLLAGLMILEHLENASGAGTLSKWWPWVLAPGALTAQVIVAQNRTIGGLAAAVVLLVFGFFEPRLRRRRVLEKVLKQIATECERRARPPHFIAHSLGTFLLGSTLQDHALIRAAQVILVSSVLPQEFDWSAVFKVKNRHELNVRNEYGAKDRIVYLAGLSSRIRKTGLGVSGLHGFRSPNVLIHDLPTVSDPCIACEGQRARIHNVPLDGYGHSTVFLTRLHAVKLWLPMFWGYVPAEYGGFLELCEIGAEAQYSEDQIKYELAADELGGRPWSWTNGKKLRAFTEGMLITLQSKRCLVTPWSQEHQTARALGFLCQEVAEALNEQLGARAPREDIIMSLIPTRAISRAVERALAEEI